MPASFRSQICNLLAMRQWPGHLTFQPQFPPTPTSHGYKDSMKQHSKLGAHFKPSGSRSCPHRGCYNSWVPPLLPSKARQLLLMLQDPTAAPLGSLFSDLSSLSRYQTTLSSCSISRYLNSYHPPLPCLPLLYFSSWH